jgi:hypothetical protein
MLIAFATACGGDPASPAERRELGDSLVEKMSGRLASVKALSLTAQEEIQRQSRTGEPRIERLTRQVTVQRPNRLYMKVSGARDLEVFYEGERLTMVAHREKVFGEFKTPPTLDETVDLIGERYGIPLPIGDLLTNSAQKALMSGQTKGGWVGRDTLDGVRCARLEWQHPNVDWTIWIPEEGDPLPRKLHIVYKLRRGAPAATVLMKDWNLNPAVTDATFVRRIPDDYEGIAIIQRASAVLGNNQPAAAATAGRP